MILYNGTEQGLTYLIWGLLLTNNEFKHNDMKRNIIDKHLHILMMMMKRRWWQDIDGDDEEMNKQTNKQTNTCNQ